MGDQVNVLEDKARELRKNAPTAPPKEQINIYMELLRVEEALMRMD